MKKRITVILAVVMLLSSVPAFAQPDRAPADGQVPQSVYQQIESAGLAVGWLELDGKYKSFDSYNLEEGYFNVQVTNEGEYVSNRYGQSFFSINGGWGKVNLSGQVVVPFVYDYQVGQFSDGLADVFIYKKEGETGSYISGFVNETGEVVIPLEYDDVSQFREGMAAAEIGVEWLPTEGGHGNAALQEGAYGYLDTTGQWAIKPRFSRAGYFYNGVAVVEIGVEEKDEEEERYYTLSGLIDKTGNMVVDFDQKLSLSYIRGTKYYAAHSAADYHSVEKYGLLDNEGKEILPFEYDYIMDVNDGKATVRKNGKEGLVDLQGKAVIPLIYDDISIGYPEPSKLVKATRWLEAVDSSKQLTTYYDWDGNVVIPEKDYYGGDFQYEVTSIWTDRSWDSSLPFYMDYHSGAINMKGEEIIPPKYQSVSAMADDRLSVSFGGYSALFDEQGNRLTSFQYGNMGDFTDGLSVVSRDGYYGLINKYGKEVVPAVFTDISAINNGKVMVAVGSQPSETARLGILELTPEMAEQTDSKPNFIRAAFNGSDISFDQDPVIEDGRTLVPMRAIFEETGAEVEWDHDKQQVTGVRKTAGKEAVEIILTIGEKTAYVNGEAVELEVAAAIHGGRTFVPLRFVAESMDMDVKWDEEQQLIIITE